MPHMVYKLTEQNCINGAMCRYNDEKSGQNAWTTLIATFLALLGADARMSVATLSRRLKVARSTIQARLERLETTGIIAGYTLKLGEAAREGRLRASVLLTIEPRSRPPS